MKILLLTPPFTQLNTPYPATAYLKGFLNTLGHRSAQADLGIEVMLRILSKAGLTEVFAALEQSDREVSDNSYRIYQLREHYLETIDPVIAFLQHQNPSLAHAICGRQYLPEANRFEQLDDLEWAFGTMGQMDKARHFATLYLEDIADLIKEAIDPHFGFSRYAERLGRAASSFDEMEAAIHEPDTLVTRYLQEILSQFVIREQPTLVCLSAPFPGNLFGAFKIGQYLKANHPEIKIAFGGGYPNTELRRLTDPRVFQYFDFICLDDGEAPLQFLLEHLVGERPASQLKRTYLLEEGQVRYKNGAKERDVPQREVGTPDYADLPIERYLSVIEIANPMHSLWSNGRWNKLTLAHGCYWGKCTFCDVSLDYIQRYEPVDATMLCDRIEQLIAETGEIGFHFVDEAAPPALMRDLALEILRRKLNVVWWTNIRFEKRFTPDLCRLLKASGCIAISGGLEVASDRLLKLIKKGVTVAQVARVTEAFTNAGIMVHAYLMYGFPTQTDQETIDALEMVRQLFEQGVLQSAFWHQFAMTAHSPVGLEPAAFGVVETGPHFEGFADNDRFHDDPSGTEHERFSEGLRKSLFNYMHGIGFEMPHAEWFDFSVPPTTVSPDYIEQVLAEDYDPPSGNAQIVWGGPLPELEELSESVTQLNFYFKQEVWGLKLPAEMGYFLQDILPSVHISAANTTKFTAFATQWSEAGFGELATGNNAAIFAVLREKGLWVV